MSPASQYLDYFGVIRCNTCHFSVAVPKYIQNNPLRVAIFHEEFDRRHKERGHLAPGEKMERVRLFKRPVFNPLTFDFSSAVRAAERNV